MTTEIRVKPKSKLPVQDLETKKKIQVFSNGMWKPQAHLEQLFNLCCRNHAWFVAHVKKMEKGNVVFLKNHQFKIKA